MKKINASVHIQCIQKSENIDLEVDDDATDSDIEKKAIDLAMQGYGDCRIVHYPETYNDVEYEIVDDEGDVIVGYETIQKERLKMAKQDAHNKTIFE
jgi:hypothetical protein